MAETVRVGDVGYPIEAVLTDSADAAVDVSTASVKQILLQKADCDESALTAVFTTDGTDGKIRYVSVAATFDKANVGTWKYQGHVELADGRKFTSKEGSFEVQDLIGD